MDAFTLFLAAMGIGILTGSIVWMLLMFVLIGIEHVSDLLARYRRHRIARIEAELDSKQTELRRTILSLAEQLAAERDEASRQITRTAYLASGVETPTRSASDA